MRLYSKKEERIYKADFLKVMEVNNFFINAIDCEINSSDNLFKELKTMMLEQKIRKIINVNGLDTVVHFSRYEYLITKGKWESEVFNFIKAQKKQLSNRYFFIDNSIIDYNILISYFKSGQSISVYLDDFVSFNNLALFHSIATELNAEIYFYSDNSDIVFITDSYLEAFRIKEENRGIKLTKEQSPVLESLDDQCRWWYIPTDNLEAIFKTLGIQSATKEAEITTIIDDVQRENTIAIATFMRHTIIFGCNAPYISYTDLETYREVGDNYTHHLQQMLNKLSKVFGTAAYFEYNHDDEQIASLAISKKGKFTYGRFSSEGQGEEIFGTQKKSMEVNQNTILKTAKKLGMTPEDILVGMMKQKMSVRCFDQPNWFIQSMLNYK